MSNFSPKKNIVRYNTSRVSTNLTKKEEEDMERSICFICATEHPQHWALYECGHRVCSLCSLRLRLLYGNKKCSLCKVESPKVLFIKGHADAGAIEHTGNFAELFTPSALTDPRHIDLFFLDLNGLERVMFDTKLRCPVTKCRDSKRGWATVGELKQHVSSAHNAEFCDICLKNKKAFPFEQIIFKPHELLKHQGNSSRKEAGAHPSCGLCNTYFYSEDELNDHYRDKHEQCHLCRRRLFASTAGNSANSALAAQAIAQQRDEANKRLHSTYYRDYAELEGHFRRDHYLCTDPMCLELKFVVFESDLDYKAHMSEVHISSMKLQRAAQNNFRRIEANISYGDRPSSSRGGRRSDGSTGRIDRNKGGRGSREDLSALPISTSSLPPLPSSPHVTILPERLVFGEAIGQLAAKLQSLSLYEKRNEEFLHKLSQDYRFNKQQLASFRSLCTQFQKGTLTSMQFVLKLDVLIGNEKLGLIAPSLVELQLDSMKRLQLDQDIKTHLTRLAAFPALPPPSVGEGAKRVSSVRLGGPVATSSSSPSYKGNPIANQPVILRIKPMPRLKQGGVTLADGVDPSKNPLALIGFIGRSDSSSSGKVPQRPKPITSNQTPSFRQAIATSSSAAIVDDIPKGDAQAILNEDEFPVLHGLKTPAKTTPVLADNIFATAPNRNELETFTIGDSKLAESYDNRMEEMISFASTGEPSASDSTVAASAGIGDGKGKKKKGVVLLKYG